MLETPEEQRKNALEAAKALSFEDQTQIFIQAFERAEEDQVLGREVAVGSSYSLAPEVYSISPFLTDGKFKYIPMDTFHKLLLERYEDRIEQSIPDQVSLEKFLNELSLHPGLSPFGLQSYRWNFTKDDGQKMYLECKLLPDEGSYNKQWFVRDGGFSSMAQYVTGIHYQGEN